MASAAETTPLLHREAESAPSPAPASAPAPVPHSSRERWRLILQTVACALAAGSVLLLLAERRGVDRAGRVRAAARVAPPTLFAVGDWGRAGCCGQHPVAAALAAAGAAAGDFRVLSTGDNFYEHGVRSLGDPQFNASYEQVYNVHAALARAPFWPVLGNHDHLGDALAQVAYSARSAAWAMPARYYSRAAHPALRLVFLDTTPFLDAGDGGDEAAAAAARNGFARGGQAAWLARTLADAPESHFLVVGHHNMYSGSTIGHRGERRVRDPIEPILRRYGDRVLGYVSGHEHALMHLHVHGVDHFVSGAGSQLDEVKLLSLHKRRHHWRVKWGVVRGHEAPFVQSVHGFFRFRFDPEQGRFEAAAIGKDSQVIYVARKRVRTARQVWGLEKVRWEGRRG